MKCKRKIIGGFLALTIATVVAFNIYMNTRENGMSTLVLANLEALAGFEFDGTDWDDDHHWYNGVGNNWKPIVANCSRTTNSGGSITVGPVGVSWTGSSTSYNGKRVSCVNGNGNCVNGTNCIPT